MFGSRRVYCGRRRARSYAKPRVLYPQELDVARGAVILTLVAAGWSIPVFFGRANAFRQRLILTRQAAIRTISAEQVDRPEVKRSKDR
jgi:hypothetical protein